MAAHLKKRALAEFSHVIQEESKPPAKKLRLIHKPKIVESQLSLQNATTSHDAMQALLRFEDTLPVGEEQAEQTIRILLEHLYKEKESGVRAKVVMLLAELSQSPGYDPSPLVDDIITAMKREESNKVISQMLAVLLALGSRIPGDEKAHATILQVATQHLSSRCQRVRGRALEVVGGLGSPEPRLQALLASFTGDGDPRVRAAALTAMLTWHSRGLCLERDVYSQACKSLTDNSETVRMTATKLVWVVSQLYPDEIITVPESEEEIRLIDDGFAKICNMVNDSCMRVRAEAAGLLGSLHAVSPRFLEQTLDKKLMSNMRKKTSAHERQREHFKSGEWSTGKKWADDAPKENVEADQISLINSGACGAFVHGFEDEFMEVRNAAIDSLCELASQSASFAALSQDFLVDMFNDEIESVRLNAIRSLRKIAHHIVLREDQLDIIMGCLKDYSYEIREALREMFHYVKMATKACLNGTILGLLDNLKRYPQDRLSIWKCMQHLGRQQPHLALPMVPDLLSIHPYFESIEPDMDDPAYVSVVLLVYNAAVTCPTMISLFPEHTKRHYTYLRDTFPDMVPKLKLSPSSCVVITENSASESSSASPSEFLEQSLVRLHHLESMDTAQATSLINMAIRDLNRVSAVCAPVAATAECVSLFLQCQLSLDHVLATRNQDPSAHHNTAVNQIMAWTYQLEHQFVGLSISQRAAIWQLRLRAQTLQLLALLRLTTSGSKAACISFLQLLNQLGRSLSLHSLLPDAFTASLLACMDKLELCEPAVYLSLLQAALRHHRPRSLPTAAATCSLQRATAVTLEPAASSGNEHKFSAGLTLGLPLVAELHNVTETQNVRIRVEYPNQEVHVIIPKASDIRQLTPLHHRLVTTVILANSVWSEACDVSISLVLRYDADKEITLEKVETPEEKLIQLCKPVKVLVAPKPIKK